MNKYLIESVILVLANFSLLFLYTTFNFYRPKSYREVLTLPILSFQYALFSCLYLAYTVPLGHIKAQQAYKDLKGKLIIAVIGVIYILAWIGIGFVFQSITTILTLQFSYYPNQFAASIIFWILVFVGITVIRFHQEDNLPIDINPLPLAEFWQIIQPIVEIID